MTLDVVVVTHQSAGLLRRALDGLPPEANVIVVDNASTDGSAEVARAAGALVVANPVNAGFGAAANLGVSLGHGDLVLLLNPDAAVEPETVRSLVGEFATDPTLAVLSPRLRAPDGSEQQVRWPFPSAGRSWREALGLHRVGLAGPTGDAFVIGACFMVRREAFEAVGGFDPAWWLYGEETDLCRRLLDAGWKVGLAEDLWAEHEGGASGEGVADLVFEHFERGGERFVRVHDGAATLLSYRLANLVGATARAVVPGSADRRRFHARRARRQASMVLRTPLTVPTDNPVTATPGEGLVVCSLERWDEVWRRNQFFVRELLRADPNRRILFVEPPFDRVLEARRPSGRQRERGLRPLPADGRIVRFEPVKTWPRVLGAWADRSLRRQVRRTADRMGLDEPTLWVNDPHYAGLASSTGWPAVYDITDDWSEAGDGDRATRRVRRDEALLFHECDEVAVCSEGLARTRRPQRPDLVVIPNAVDAEELRRARPRPSDLPTAPTAVYVGTLHEDRLDVDLVERLAASLPELSVVLVGPDALSTASREQLAACGNVHLLGPRPFDAVPGYLQHADVLVVPHVVSPFTESLDPIKAYECLAVGVATVATPVAGFRDAGGAVRCADRELFVAAVAGVLAAAPPAQPIEVPSWAVRARAFDALLRRATIGERPLRVVFLDHCAELSGGELALERVLPALLDRGVEAHVILGEQGPLEQRLAATGATVEVLALDEGLGATRRDEVRAGGLGVGRAAALARDVRQLRGRLRELGPDLVHTNSLKAALYGGIAARWAGVPVVWHIRDRIADDYLPSAAVRLVRGLGRALPRAIVVNSAATAETLAGAHGTGNDPVSVVHDAVPASAVRLPSPGGRRADSRFTVAMVGRLAPWKGQDVFLDAFARAFPAGPERAVIAGSAMFGEETYEARLREQVARLGLADRVEMLGFVDDVPGLLASADCMVHASVIPEPFGQVVLEGMAAGCPVIAADAGGPAEVVTDGVDGLLSPPGDPLALAERLVRLEADPALRRRLVEAGRNRAGQFSPETTAEKLIEVYRSVMTRR